METNAIQDIVGQISGYVTGLDWSYILTFIIIAYGFNHGRVRNKIKGYTRLTTKRRYRITIVGALYAIIIYFIRDYQLFQVEVLFRSFIFSIVFHKLIIDGVITYFSKRISIQTHTNYEDKYNEEFYEE